MTTRRVLLSGSSGLIGSALVPYLRSAGYEVLRLVRHRDAAAPDAVFWDPEQGLIEKERLSAIDAVVNLAGENIASRRWSRAFKDKIYNSRIRATELLVRTIKDLSPAPRVLVSASAVGLYGDGTDRWFNEDDPPGSGFLAHICRNWEAAAGQAASLETRVVCPRIGVVLSRRGGALAKMLPVFRLGLAGRIGSGHQYMSWISLPDLCTLFQFLIERVDLSGPVNAVAPQAVTNAEFTAILAGILHRPALFPLPALLARLIFGELADETILRSTRVKPGKLLQAGFVFQQASLSGALSEIKG